MDNYNKRLFLTLAMCFAATVIYTKFFLPPPPAAKTPTTQNATSQLADGNASDAGRSGNATTSPAQGGDEAPGAGRADALVSGDSTGAQYAVTGGSDDSPITIGGDSPEDSNPYRLELVIDPVGASVQTVTLADHRQTVKRRKKDPTPPAYRLLEPLKNEANGIIYRSFVAESLRLPDDNVEIRLADLTWKAKKTEDTDSESVELSAVVKDGDFDAFRLTRTYRIQKGDHQFELQWHVENLTEKPHRILLTGSGPIGVQRADSRFDNPRVMVAVVKPDGTVKAGDHVMKSKVIKEEARTHTFKTGEDHVYWYALSNKYFTCIVYPKPADDKATFAPFLDRVSAMPRFPGEEDFGDLTTEQVLAPTEPVAPGPDHAVTLSLDVYCGDKDEKTFEAMLAATARHYILTTSPDRSACTFESIGVLMRWLLNKLYLLVRNYGLAIILLVVIVRLCLHPITRKGQINMMKMQKNQARLKPKLEALQAQFKNDKQRLGEETMKLYREEGINPASTLSGCLPMLLQTPIWIALYTTLNTGISLRHQPFFGYIRDLSAPDVLVQFDWSFKIPLLGAMMGPITSLNILPIIMAGVMFAQMKLSQKMAKDKKAEEAAEKAKLATGGEAETPADMMAQQQKMMMFMMPLFGLMFYNMPSGLCLYILSNSVLGMVELYFIRKKLRDDEKAGKLDVSPKKPKKQGRMGRFLEDLQKKAEEARLAQAQAQGPKPKGPAGKGKKKPRF